MFLTALGPPGGGRTFITPRIIRHFNMLSYNEMDNQTVNYIFNTITNYFLKRFTDEVREIIPQLISSVLGIYENIRINLLPTPKRSHYTFNLRDISKVFQGICSASPKEGNSKISMVKLWFHEIFRVFGDRLINNEDRTYLNDTLKEKLKIFGYEIEQVQSREKLIFCDFWHGKDQDPRHYMEVPDLAKFIEKIYEYQEEYNADPKFSGTRGKNALKLVLFQDAC